MPTDQTSVALNLCSRLAAAADGLMKAIESISAVSDQMVGAGIDFTAPEIEAALAASSLKHASGADFASVITSGLATKEWLEAGFHDDIYQKVRSGGTT